MSRLSEHRGPSPRYCAYCGVKITDMQANACIGNTPHVSEADEASAARFQVASAAGKHARDYIAALKKQKKTAK